MEVSLPTPSQLSMLGEVLREKGCSTHVDILTFQGKLNEALYADKNVLKSDIKEHFSTLCFKTSTLIQAIDRSKIVNNGHIKASLAVFPNALRAVYPPQEDGHSKVDLNLHTFQEELKKVLRNDGNIRDSTFRVSFNTTYLKIDALITAIAMSGIVKNWHIRQALDGHQNAIDTVFPGRYNGDSPFENFGELGQAINRAGSGSHGGHGRASSAGPADSLNLYTFQSKLRQVLEDDIYVSKTIISQRFGPTFTKPDALIMQMASSGIVECRHIRAALYGHQNAIDAVFPGHLDDRINMVLGRLGGVLDACSANSESHDIADAARIRQAQAEAATDRALVAEVKAQSALEYAKHQEECAARLRKDLEDAARAPAPVDECVICMNAPKEYAMFPCKHLCLCEGCAGNFEIEGHCPICRGVIKGIEKIY